MHFWIFACGGNKYQWNKLSLCGEVWAPAKVIEEQAQKFHFDKIAGLGMFYALIYPYALLTYNIQKFLKSLFFRIKTIFRIR